MERERSASSSIRVVEAGGPMAPGVGKYRYIATLDEGGMADVFLAVTRDTGFEKLVVIKQLRAALAAEDPTFVAMFTDEARLAARLNHPNVVQTIEVGSDQGVHFIAMEFLEGVPYVRFARLKDRVPTPLAFHVRILVETLRGLHYAHELRDFDGRPLGVVHRDVSPQNVMLTFEGGVKVLDFGIAKAALASEKRPDDFKGKLEYMSPEQALLDDVDRRADLFSIGIMLWESLAGRRFYAKGEDKYLRLVEARAPDVLSVAPLAPNKLARICMRALARDRTERFATAEEMADALEEWLGGTGQHVSARDVGTYIADKFEARRAKLSAAIAEQLERFRALGEPSAPLRGAAPPSADALAIALTRLPTTDMPPRSPPPPAPMVRQVTMPLISSQALLPPPPFVAPPPPAVVTVPAPNARAPSSARSTSLSVGVATALLGGVVLGGGVFFVAQLAHGGEDAPAPLAASSSAAPAAPEASSAAEAPADVAFTIKASPANATITIDGKAMDANPAVGTRPRDAAVHVVRVAAPGFEPREERLSFDRSFLLTIDLRAIAPPASAAEAPATAPAPATKTRTGPTRPKPPVRPATTATKGRAAGGNLDKENPYE